MPDSTYATRPPVVTILGHVDHGKTSLLDRIRHATVAAGEIGGITQAIGAYQIEHNDKKITFIDTPGHAAFSAMRRRGGQAADVAILIVAADDSVMPQTKESIEHIKSAGIPFVVAVNKTDLPGVNPERVKTDLANEGVFVEGYGGNVPIVNISAKTGEGVDELLEIILLLAELEELKDNSDACPATALVIESSMHPQKGPLATLLVKSGTFVKNDPLFDGKTDFGKIRSMIDYSAKFLDKAIPSTPFQVIGFSKVPSVGDIITSEPCSDKVTKSTSGASDVINEEKPTIVLKADVQGSLEAIVDSIQDQANIVESSVGQVTDTDIETAIATGAEILGFNVKMPASVTKLAEVEHVKFSNFRIIYQLFDYLKELKEQKDAQAAPKVIITGEAKILKVFNFGGTIVYGCQVTSGKISIGDTVKDSQITSLKVGKEDVQEAKKDQECGLVLSPSIDIKAGDIMTATTIEK
ncbi:MAG TPA: GTP-binding protein [Candidatus Woesebacteria bacterium]|mgnify:CR=1 FL=1|nr:GTP-binding protein [Candidatus Woesebacteria bacterium]